MVNYEKIKIIVFTKTKKDMESYYKLFKFLLGDRVTGGREFRAQGNIREAHLEGERFLISFYGGLYNARGHKAHYVIDLTNDTDFHHEVALPITIIHHYIKEDPKWSELF